MKRLRFHKPRTIAAKLKRVTSRQVSLLRALINGRVPLELAEQTLVKAVRDNPFYIAHYETNIEIVFAMQKGLRSSLDPIGGNRWLHYRWLEILNELFEDLGEQLSIPGDFNYVHVGAGNRNPLV